MTFPSRRERYRGALLGLAAGDALGTTLEFAPRDVHPPVTDMVGGGPFALAPGQWTDDTSMALCLAASLIESSDFDPVDQMSRYVRWWRHGYMSSTGSCFDIGGTTAAAMARFEREGTAFAGSTDPYSAGNGSLMRLAPVVLRYAHAPEEALARAADSSRTTHAAPEAVDACRYFASLLLGALSDVDKEDLLDAGFMPNVNGWSATSLSPQVAAIAAGSFKRKERREIRSSGYVVHTLEAALWAFHSSTTFRDGAVLAVNLAEDADTVGAVYGQIAGAYYGEHGIPTAWLTQLACRREIEELADGLLQRSRPT
jgi:ADP-ribosylglycohydrolase